MAIPPPMHGTSAMVSEQPSPASVPANSLCSVRIECANVECANVSQFDDSFQHPHGGFQGELVFQHP
eukprot:4770373-Pyramimonas_sp.AAC.1